MPKISKRVRQIADMIQRYLSLALRQEIKDPRLVGVSITDVVLSPDLKMAKVYFSVIKDSDLPTVQAGLLSATGHFRHIIATNLDLRFTPAITFYYDETIEQAERLDRLLQRVPGKSTDEPSDDADR